MKLRTVFACLLALVLVSSTWAFAQDSSANIAAHPKVLVVIREWEKLNAGAEHNKTESAFVAALKKADYKSNYFAACGVTGKPRCLFFSGFDSYDAWFKSTREMYGNKDLSAELDPINKADTDLLQNTEVVAMTYSSELSYKDDHSVATARFLEADVMRVKPGHMGDFSKLVKMVKEANDKAGTDSHWSAFQVSFGGDPSSVVFYTADKNAAELDHSMVNDSKMWSAMSALEKQEFESLYAKSVDVEQSELLTINPAMSYPPDSWVKADPDFWTPKPAEAPAKGKEKKK